MAKTALEMGGSSEPIRLAVKDGLDRLHTIIAQCIHEGQTQDEMTTRHDAETLADLLLNAWEGVLMRAQLNLDDRPITVFLRITIDELLMP